MKITKEAWEAITSYPQELPPEVGGIIGSRALPHIDAFVGDPGREGPCGCSYTPDTAFLNEIISQWQKEGILFQGIAHTHFHGVRSLSEGDKEYMARILMAMPPQIPSLFFPIIVLPERKLVSYRASMVEGELVIEDDLVQVI